MFVAAAEMKDELEETRGDDKDEARPRCFARSIGEGALASTAETSTALGSLRTRSLSLTPRRARAGEASEEPAAAGRQEGGRRRAVTSMCDVRWALQKNRHGQLADSRAYMAPEPFWRLSPA